MAASLKAVSDVIDQYDTVVIVGAYYPDSCGQTPPAKPITPFYGNTVETKLGDFEVDVELRDKMAK